MENGRTVKLMGMEFINGRMEIGMRVSGGIALSMDREQTFLLMETHLQDNINMANQMDLDNTSGLMAALILENLKMVLKMEKVNGKKWEIQLIAIVMKVNICLIKRMDMGYLHGKVETYIKEIIRKMKGMDKAKCIGLMAQFIKDNGVKGFNMDKVE